MLPYHLSSHTENLCYKKCRHKDFTSESYRACSWRQCESAGHNSRGRLNMFFVQIFAVISLLAFQIGIVCTCNCFLLLDYKLYILMEHFITFQRIFKLSIKNAMIVQASLNKNMSAMVLDCPPITNSDQICLFFYQFIIIYLFRTFDM